MIVSWHQRGCCLLAAGLLAATGRAAAPAPLSEAGYAVIDLPEAGRQFMSGAVLALARTPDGQLVVGSNQLAVFDGHGWQRIEVPEVTRFLSLAAESSLTGGAQTRVWFGAHGALGYVERHSTGEWRPTILNAPLAAAGLADLSDIVRVEPDGRGGAVFLTRSRVLRWDGTAFRIWELPNTIRLYSFVYRNVMHICQPGVGLFRMTADGPQLWLRQSELPGGQPLVDMIDVPGGGALAISSSEDLFRLTAAGWQPAAETSAHLKGGRAARAVRVDAGTIALGTAYGGVVLVRNDGSLIGLVNTHNGLPDDTTDKMLGDGEGGLWISTGSGLVRLSGAGRASLFDQRTWLAYGDIRRVREHAGRPWVLTSRRAYELAPAPATGPARFNRLETFWPQLRDGVVRGGSLWLCGAGGLWRVHDGAAVREPAVAGDTYQVVAPDWMPDGLVYADRDSLHALLPAGPGWRSVPLNQPLESPATSALLDRAGRLWVATRGGHVRAYAWDAASTTLRLLVHHRPGRGLPAGSQAPALVQWGEGVAILTGVAVLACPDPLRPVTLVPGLADFIAEHAVVLPDGTMLWGVRHRDRGAEAPQAIIRVRPAAGPAGATWEPVAVPGLDRLGLVTSISITGSPGREALWIGGENALLRLAELALAPAPAVPAAQLHTVRFNGTHRAPLWPAPRQVFGPEVSQLAFAYSVGTDTQGLCYQSRLHGIESAWSAAQAVPGREFTGLPPGSYEFAVRAIDRFGRTGPATVYAFLLEPPWYWRTWALVLWAALLVLTALAAVRWRFRRLKLQTARLNQLVNERTRELSLSNTARAEFLDSLSHELRRPLRGITSLIRQLEGSDLKPVQRKHAQLLLQGTESLSRVCDEVLNYSKLEYGAAVVESRPFRLGDLLATVVTEGEPGCPPPPVRWPPDFVDGFVGDDLKLQTIVANFVTNAQRHAAGAPIEIEISGDDEAAGQVSLLIEVTDGGPGVPAEEQELIFKRFVRGSQARQARTPGTGIGLATCRVLAQLLGGSVGVESPAERARTAGWPGPGATFFVCLPLTRAPAAAAGVTAPAGARGSG